MEKAQALDQADVGLIPATCCHVILDKSFTSLSLSSHLEQDAKAAETCVPGCRWEGFAQGWGPPRRATRRDEAMRAVEGSGCFVLASRVHGGHVPGGQGQVGRASCPHNPSLPPRTSASLQESTRTCMWS